MSVSRGDRVGPYRLDDRLGGGGMGEVYRAYDERLERWVAIKLIRADSASGAAARARFRREARAAAALNHPVIVQIYHIIELDESDALVMELVEGGDVARLLCDGPMDPEKVIRLGREVAEGLAAAHAHDLVHRDLKAENVMVTTAGHAKILDFGVAKRMLESENEPGLTLAGMVVGTYRAMSPEQARGLPVDARSDLFSLGTLLYEMLTGESPFVAPGALDTLSRICTLRQAPVAALRAGTPAALSELVDRLLEKDPGRRPQTAAEVALELAGLAGSSSSAAAHSSRPSSRAGFDLQETWVDGPPRSLPHAAQVTPGPAGQPVGGTAAPRKPARAAARWWLAGGALAAAILGTVWVLRAPHPAPLHVAVVRPELGAGTARQGSALMASGMRLALLRGLLALRGVSPLAPEQVDPIVGPPRAVARATAADEVVTSRLDCAGEDCRVSLSRVRGSDGGLLWTESFAVPADQPYLLAAAVSTRLRASFPDRGAREDATGFEVRPGDFSDYLRLRAELDSRRQDPSSESQLSRLAAIEAGSPHFLEAYILETGLLRQRFHVGRDSRDLRRAIEAAQRGREVAPDDPRSLSSLFEVLLDAEDLGGAGEVLRQLERLQPGDPAVTVLRARLAERRGDKQQALELMRDAIRRQPSWLALLQLADMEYRLGESEAARRDIHSLLHRFPGSYSGQSLLAQVELAYGDPQRAAAIYADLVRASPHETALTNLGLCYLLLKRYPEAEERFRQVRSLVPKSPVAALNLADVVLLRGNRPEAEAIYREVLDLSERDPAAGNWQLRSIRAQALAHLGRRSEAVAAAQEVLMLARGNAQASYEVSLVYALVGDQSSAQFNAERAISQGFQARWFSFPWFDSLRGSTEFKDLLAHRSGGRPYP